MKHWERSLLHCWEMAEGPLPGDAKRRSNLAASLVLKPKMTTQSHPQTAPLPSEGSGVAFPTTPQTPPSSCECGSQPRLMRFP